MQIRCVFRRSGRGRIEGGLRFRIGPTGRRGGWGTLTQGFVLVYSRVLTDGGREGREGRRLELAGIVERPVAKAAFFSGLLSWA